MFSFILYLFFIKISNITFTYANFHYFDCFYFNKSKSCRSFYLFFYFSIFHFFKYFSQYDPHTNLKNIVPFLQLHSQQMNRTGSRKRRRFSGRSKRPIDKNIIVFSLAVDGAGQTEATLWPPAGAPATGSIFPGTITGIRWNLSVRCVISTTVRFAWAIVRIRESQTASALVLPNTIGILYRPEQDVIVCGHEMIGVSNNNTNLGFNEYKIEGSTKSMRKIQNGDRLLFLCQDDDANVRLPGSTNAVAGIVEYFIKT